MVNSHIRERQNQLILDVEKALPEVKELCKKTEIDTIWLFHQDAFAADYQEEEFLLLGKAIKYVGMHGKEIRIIGKNQI
jgi:hypothetical protein